MTSRLRRKLPPTTALNTLPAKAIGAAGLFLPPSRRLDGRMVTSIQSAAADEPGSGWHVAGQATQHSEKLPAAEEPLAPHPAALLQHRPPPSRPLPLPRNPVLAGTSRASRRNTS